MKSLFPPQRTTPLPGGYMGKILRVDLTTGAVKDENLPEEPILKKFIGGQALALYILMNELPLDATPFGPENIVVMMTGPLTGNGFTPRRHENDGCLFEPAYEHDSGPRRHQRILGNLSQSRGLRRRYSPGCFTEAGLSLHQGRQGRITRRRASLGSRHPRHRRSLA